MAPLKRKAQQLAKKSAQKPEPEARRSLETTKKSSPKDKAAMESGISSSSRSPRADRLAGKKRPRVEDDDDEEEEGEETPAPASPSSASAPVPASAVGTTQRTTRSSSRAKIALDGPVTLASPPTAAAWARRDLCAGEDRPPAPDTTARSSAFPDRISAMEDRTALSVTGEGEPLSSQSRTNDAAPLSSQAGTNSALGTELSAVRREIEDMESELAATKRRLEYVSPYFELMERALENYPSPEDWNNAKVQLPPEFARLRRMNFDELKTNENSYHIEKNNLLETANRLKKDKEPLIRRKEQLEQELKPVKASGTTRSITSSVLPSMTAFLSTVTAKKDLPLLSLEAFGQLKGTHKVSELTRVDVLPREGADVEPVLQGFVLPTNISWPFFGVAKQESAEDKHVLVHRLQGMNKARSEKVFSVVKGGGSVAIIGSPGIGKSCSMNYFLMEFVRHLGEPGWKKVVLARYGKTFLKIFRDEVSREIKCEESVIVGLENLSLVLGEIPLKEKPQMVLLLELSEKEVDPEIGAIPCVVNRDAREVLKTMEKMQKLHWFLEEPHSEEEAEAVVRLLNAASRSGKYDWEKVVKPRWELIPRPRQYLSDATLETNIANNFFDVLNQASVFNVPAGASNVLAPYYVKEATDPDVLKSLPNKPLLKCYEMKFLSLEAALRVGQRIKADGYLSAVEELGVRWQIEEAYAAYGGLLKGKESMLDVQFTRKQWEWFEDLGPGEDCLTGENKFACSLRPAAVRLAQVLSPPALRRDRRSDGGGPTVPLPCTTLRWWITSTCTRTPSMPCRCPVSRASSTSSTWKPSNRF